MEKKKSDEIKVFISLRESTCGECGENLGKKAWITLDPAKGALCLACADLDHLIFLQAGDMALTVRSKKYSKLSAVVLQFSRARKRYERQGLLVQTEALVKAEQECLSDADVRERRQQREKRTGAWSWIETMSCNLQHESVSCIQDVRLEGNSRSPNMHV